MALWDRLTGNDQRKRAEEERRQLEQARIASLNRARQSANPVIAQKAQTKMQNNAWQVQAKPQPTFVESVRKAPIQVANNTVNTFVKPIARSANTAGAMVTKAATVPFAAADLTKESLLGTDNSYKQKLNAYNRFLRKGGLGKTGGLMNAGTTLQNVNELNDPKKFAGSVLETGTDLGSFVPTGKAVKAGATGVKALKPLLNYGGANAAMNTAGAAGMQLRETGKVDPKGLIAPAAVGFGLPAAGYGLGRVVKPAVKPTVQAGKFINDLGKPTGQALQNLQTAKANVDTQITDLLQKRSIAQTRKPDLVPILDRQIDDLYSQSEGITRKMNTRGQGGFVANPLYKGDNALMAEARKYDKWTDFVNTKVGKTSIFDPKRAEMRQLWESANADKLAKQTAERDAARAAKEANRPAPNPEQWVSSKPIRMPDQVFRGTGKDGGTGMSMYGSGLYTAAAKKEAAKYGKVTKLPADSLPKNPLQFKTDLDFKQWEYETARKLGVDKRDLYGLNKGVESIVQPMGYDGITIGQGKDMIAVKYGEPPKSKNPLKKLSDLDKKLGQGGYANADPTKPTIKNMFGEEVPNPAYKAPQVGKTDYTSLKPGDTFTENGKKYYVNEYGQWQEIKTGNAPKTTTKTVKRAEKAFDKYLMSQQKFTQATGKANTLNPENRVERLMSNANMLDDNQTRRAARAVLERDGIDWKSPDVAPQVGKTAKEGRPTFFTDVTGMRRSGKKITDGGIDFVIEKTPNGYASWKYDTGTLMARGKTEQAVIKDTQKLSLKLRTSNANDSFGGVAQSIINKPKVDTTPVTQPPKSPFAKTLEDVGIKKESAVATKPKVGTATSRVVPQIDEPFDAPLTKTGEQGIVPPKKPPVDGTPPQLTAGKQKKTRFADKTVPDSEFVSKEIKGSIKSPSYSVQTEKQGYASALGRLKAQGDDAFEQKVLSNLEKKNGTISRQDAIDAQTLAAVLDGGDDASVRKATQIYERLSEHYTAAGQLTQAAAVIARRSPEGLRSYATKTLKSAGVTMTQAQEKQLTTLIKAVKEASPEAKPKAQYKVMDFVAKNTPTSTGDKIVNTWRAGLLTAPTTTFGNVLGNTGEAVIRKGFVNPVASAADAVMGKFTGKRTMSLAQKGSGTKGLIEGTKTLPDYLKTGYDPKFNNAKYDAPRSINTGSKVLDNYINGTYRLMGTADAPFSTLAEKEALSSIARAEALSRGLKGQAQKDFVSDFMAKPPETALARAQKEADYATFKNPTRLGKAATGLKRPLGAVGDFIVPFTQVPASIATRIIERTPVGTANEMIKQIVNVKKGGTFDQRAMSQAIGNGAVGASIMGIGFALAGDDKLTFGYPTDDKERKLWDEEGKQPFSVRVGDRWYSLNYLQPFGTLLAVGGQAKNAMNEGQTLQAALGQSAATAGQAVMNQSFLKGIGGALDAISDPERSVRKYVEQTTSSVVPNFVRSGARAADKVQRAPEGILEGIKSGIPGLRDDTTPKYGINGEPLPAKDTFANQYLNPLKPSKVRGNETVAELRRLQDKELGTMPTESNAKVFGEANKLDKKQLADLNASIAKRVTESWSGLVKTEEYKNMSDEDKKKTLDSAKKDYAAVAKADWAAKNDKISDEWQPKLTAKQKAIASGVTPDYLTAVKEKNTKDAITSKYSQEVQDFSKLTNAEKNEYFKRDPAKAKELYDQAKQMDAELGKKTSKASGKTSTKKTSSKKTSTKKTSSKTAKRGSLPNWKNISPSKGLVNTKVASVKFAPVKKPVYKGKKVTRKIA
jgi:hypothetical protein